MLISFLSIAAFLILFLGHFVFSWIRFGKKEALKPLTNIFPFLRKRFSASNSRQQTRTYLTDFHYFKGLAPEQQEKFLDRIDEFIATKEISGRSMYPTDEMKVKIAACAIQLLFGLEEFYLPFFDSIIIYDGLIVNRQGKYEYLITRTGSIAISWQAFERGYKDPSDCRNVGLHAFADAMQLGAEMFPGDDPMLSEKFEEWQKNSPAAINRLQGNVISPLKNAAATGRRTFFASCIEYFFEAPQQLRSLHPDLFEYIAKLLKQDPLAPSRSFEGSQPAAFEIKWRRQRKFAYFHVLLITLGIVAGIPSLFYFLSITAIETWLALLFPPLIFASYILPRLLREEAALMTRLSVVANAASSVIITSTLLSVNYLGSHGSTFTETFRVAHYEATRTVSHGRYGHTYITYTTVYELENDAYSSCYFLRRYTGKAPSPDLPYIRFVFSNGLLGIKTLQQTDWLNDNQECVSSEVVQSY